MAQEFIGAPILRQFHGAAPQVAVVLLEFRFEAAEKGEGIGGRPGKSRKDLIVVKPPNLLRRVFNDGLAERNLAVSGQHHAAVAADG